MSSLPRDIPLWVDPSKEIYYFGNGQMPDFQTEAFVESLRRPFGGANPRSARISTTWWDIYLQQLVEVVALRQLARVQRALDLICPTVAATVTCAVCSRRVPGLLLAKTLSAFHVPERICHRRDLDTSQPDSG